MSKFDNIKAILERLPNVVILGKTRETYINPFSDEIPMKHSDKIDIAPRKSLLTISSLNGFMNVVAKKLPKNKEAKYFGLDKMLSIYSDDCRALSLGYFHFDKRSEYWENHVYVVFYPNETYRTRKFISYPAFRTEEIIVPYNKKKSGIPKVYQYPKEVENSANKRFEQILNKKVRWELAEESPLLQ